MVLINALRCSQLRELPSSELVYALLFALLFAFEKSDEQSEGVDARCCMDGFLC